VLVTCGERTTDEAADLARLAPRLLLVPRMKLQLAIVLAVAACGTDTATNRPPTIDLASPPPAGATVCNPSCSYSIAYVVDDPDGDPVSWSLAWSARGRTGTLATGLTAGSGSVTIDADPLATDTYALTAQLDDGTTQVSVDAPGPLIVPAGHDAIPTVTVMAPNGGESYYDTQTITVAWVGNDADDATLTYDISAIGATAIPIAQVVANAGPAQATWKPPVTGALTEYKINVTATDRAARVASDTSDTDIMISPPPQSVSFASQLQPIFNASCTNELCHGATDPQAGLNLTAAAAYGGLVGVASSEPMCAQYARVQPGQPDASVLVFKLAGTGACFTGSRMPKVGSVLSPTQIQLFRDWIANGAPNN
jgi:hypothetical protein